MATKQSIERLSGEAKEKALYQHHQNYPSTSGNCSAIDAKITSRAKADSGKRTFAAIGGRWNNYDLKGLESLKLKYRNDLSALAIIDIQIHNLKCKRKIIAALPGDLAKYKVEEAKIKKHAQVLKVKKQEREKKEKVKKVLLIGGGVLALLIIGFLVYDLI